ncbi:MAG TPA: ABC transporter permease [Acidimicrobiales bacterium]
MLTQPTGTQLVAAQPRGHDGDAWVDWSWVSDHRSDIIDAVRSHAGVTVQVVFIGVLLSLPAALVSVNRPWARSALMTVSGVLYTIPSLAAFALLIPYTGLTSRATVLIPLVSYTLVILVRNILAGFDAVPEAARDAAEAMGYSTRQRLLRVELPLAMPTIMAGVRLATVSTIGLVTVAAIIGQGGLGMLIRDGLERDFRTLTVVGSVLALALAVLADVCLAALSRRLSRWNRPGAAGR